MLLTDFSLIIHKITRKIITNRQQCVMLSSINGIIIIIIKFLY